MSLQNHKRYRKASSSDDEFSKLVEESEDYVPYVPLKSRKKEKLEKIQKLINQNKAESSPKEDEDGKTRRSKVFVIIQTF